MKIEQSGIARSARDVLSSYGRDYAIGVVRSLAVRNMMSVDLPEPAQGFYPIVKIHQMALKELEEVFYGYVGWDGSTERREQLIRELIDQRVWE